MISDILLISYCVLRNTSTASAPSLIPYTFIAKLKTDHLIILHWLWSGRLTYLGLYEDSWNYIN